jgi:pimeloyl-[acyl-carrier protein] methyl ester esterase
MMQDLRIVLLPGLHGTDELAGPLLSTIPSAYRPTVIAYPKAGPHDYDSLLHVASEKMPGPEPALLIAESFSGPLAIRYAAANPSRVRGVVLSASFVLNPAPRWLGRLPLKTIFLLRPPLFPIRMTLTNGHDDPALPRLIRQVALNVGRELIASRLRAVLSLDCRADLARYTGILLYLSARRDRLVRTKSLKLIQQIRPDVRVQEIDAPHLILQTRPQDAWRAIEQFIARTAHPQHIAV